MRGWLRDWGAALAWAVLIFVLSSRPTVPVPMAHGVDKVFHFAAYLVLGSALAWGAARRGVLPWLAVLMGAAYGASDELHQLLVPGRSATLLDWLADVAGATAGVALTYSFFASLAPGGTRSRQP